MCLAMFNAPWSVNVEEPLLSLPFTTGSRSGMKCLRTRAPRTKAYASSRVTFIVPSWSRRSKKVFTPSRPPKSFRIISELSMKSALEITLSRSSSILPKNTRSEACTMISSPENPCANFNVFVPFQVGTVISASNRVCAISQSTSSVQYNAWHSAVKLEERAVKLKCHLRFSGVDSGTCKRLVSSAGRRSTDLIVGEAGSISRRNWRTTKQARPNS
mmetsp:Transcript_102915/g.220100  ORF Transcript_102915/g.220100 Transcript_102915/m.220100 type:complete len:216 (+) Transcript_102915:297-944(+)